MTRSTAEWPLIDAGITLQGRPVPGSEEILTAEALAFVAGLARRFAPRVRRLLDARAEAQASYDTGRRPGFLEETRRIREDDWSVAPIPDDLLDRRVGGPRPPPPPRGA